MNLRGWSYTIYAGCITLAMSMIVQKASADANPPVGVDMAAEVITRAPGDPDLTKSANFYNGINTNDITPLQRVVTPNPKTPSQPIITFIRDECGTTRLRGHAAVNPHNTLYVNQINPLKVINPTFDGTKKWAVDDSGTTCFSGNVGVMPCENRQMNNGRLFVNEINPVKMVKVREAGETVIGCDGKPLLTCVSDDDGVTCFSGNVAVDPKRELWVNSINPVKQIRDERTGCMICVPDDDCSVATKFSGDIQVRDKHIFGQIDQVTLTTTSTAVLKFNFGTTVTPGAYLKLYFLGTDSGNSYDVFYTQKHYINPSGSGSLNSGDTTSAVNGLLSSIDATYFDFSSSVFVSLGINATVPTTYEGCLHYEIVGCSELRSFECNPVLPPV